tara:strand:- start:300 stop:473 length:174 start_codon:yes stop_codon:yes gene_type:complete
MNEALMMAYDLKHQIDLLPSSVKGETKVDGAETELSMQQRIAQIIILTEKVFNEKVR